MTTYDPALCERLVAEAREAAGLLEKPLPDCTCTGWYSNPDGEHELNCVRGRHDTAVFKATRRARFSAMADQLEAARREVERLTGQRDRAMADAAEARFFLVDAKDTADVACADLNKHLVETEAERDALRAAELRLGLQLQAARSEADWRAESCNALTAERDVLRSELEVARITIQMATKADLQHNQRRADEAERQLEAARRELAVARGAIDSGNDAFRQLRDQWSAERDRLSRDLADCQAHRDTLTRERDESREFDRRRVADLDALAAEVEQLKVSGSGDAARIAALGEALRSAIQLGYVGRLDRLAFERLSDVLNEDWLRERRPPRIIARMKTFTAAFARAVLDALKHQTRANCHVHNLEPVTIQQALDAAHDALTTRRDQLLEDVRRAHRDLEDSADAVRAAAYAEMVSELAETLEALGERR